MITYEDAHRQYMARKMRTCAHCGASVPADMAYVVDLDRHKKQTLCLDCLGRLLIAAVKPYAAPTSTVPSAAGRALDIIIWDITRADKDQRV